MTTAYCARHAGTLPRAHSDNSCSNPDNRHRNDCEQEKRARTGEPNAAIASCSCVGSPRHFRCDSSPECDGTLAHFTSAQLAAKWTLLHHQGLRLGSRIDCNLIFVLSFVYPSNCANVRCWCAPRHRTDPGNTGLSEKGALWVDYLEQSRTRIASPTCFTAQTTTLISARVEAVSP